jgi:hypothetical protein
MRKVFLLLASAGVAVLFASGVALAVSQLDQQQTEESDFVAIPDANHPYGQTFTAGLTGSLDKSRCSPVAVCGSTQLPAASGVAPQAT